MKLRFTSLFEALRPNPQYLLLITIAAMLLLWKLGSLLPNLAPEEVSTYQSFIHTPSLLSNPIFAPYRAVQALIDHTIGSSALSLRLTSVSFASAGLLALYALIKMWFTKRLAVIAVILAVTSAWFLHNARLATPDISYLMLIPAFVLFNALQESKRHQFILSFILVIATASLIYSPGLIWFVLAAIAYRGRQLLRIWRDLPLWNIVLIGAVLFLSLTPFAWSISQNIGVLGDLAGLPNSAPSPTQILLNTVTAIRSLLLFSDPSPARNLGDLALADALVVSMAIMGAYYLFKKRTLDRSMLIFGGTLLSGLIVIMNRNTSLFVLFPFVYLFATAGIALMLQQWLTVFPRNPVAQKIGPAIIYLAMAVSVLYNINRYFIAWPQTPETKQHFNQTIQR
jgi:Dolichyl-phosphate-mannose-protein mannosyltransferase